MSQHPGEGHLRRELGVRDLVLMNTAAVIGVRWVSAAAHAGPGSIGVWLLAALLFFVPSAIAISVLSRRYPQEGGLYIWARNDFGDWHGYLCFAIYWMSAVFWFPNAAMACNSMAVYLFGAAHRGLADDRTYVLAASLATVWIALGANLVGLKVGKWVQNLGGLATYLLGVLLIGFAAIAWFVRGPATALAITPEWNWSKLNFWSQIAMAFTGLELAPIMSAEIRATERVVPKAAWISALACTAFYSACTLALLVLLVPDQISLLHGLVQAGDTAGQLLGIGWLSKLLAGLIVCAAIGQLGAFGAATARLPFAVGTNRYLPAAYARLHSRWGTPYVAILTMGLVASGFVALMQAGETLRGAYQVMVDLTVITTFIPFIYIFLSARRAGSRLSAYCGLSVTVLALVFSLVPTEDARSVWLFELKLIGGTLVVIALARLMFLHARRKATL
jgi:glutamate:GABA antiporter